MPYLHRLNRTRLLQGKCRTLLNTTVRYKMNFVRHWKILRALSILGLVALTTLSILLLEEYVRSSFVLWIYLMVPTLVHICCCLFVCGGVHVMRLNDSILNSISAVQLTWFLRVAVVLGCLLSTLSLLQLLNVHSGYLPFMFAAGSGFLWTSCYYNQKQSEQGGHGDAEEAV